MCRTTCKLGASLLFCHLIIWYTPRGYSYLLRDNLEGSIAEGTIGISETSSCNLLVPAESALAWQHTYHFLFNGGLFLCMCVQLFREYPVHDRQLRFHGNLVFHGQVFSFQ